MRLLILGCGLLGASTALAARATGTAQTIIGVDPSPASVAAAGALGVFDRVELLVEPQQATTATPIPGLPIPGLKDTEQPIDIGVAAGPPSTLADSVRRLVGVCELVVDVGSVKAPVLASLAATGSVPANYVPCHPMAGSEQAGAAAAQADLFRNRQVFVTPADHCVPELCARAHDFWRALGANTSELTPQAHDAAVAYTSHLPHLLASAYVGMDNPLPAAAGPGYHDFSRLAKANPVLWADILTANRAQVLPLIEQLQAALAEARAVLATPDAAGQDGLVDYLTERQQARERVDVAGATAIAATEVPNPE